MSEDRKRSNGRHGLKVKVYDGYGDADDIIIYGHVFRSGYHHVATPPSGVLKNSMQLVRLFMQQSAPNARVQLDWMGMHQEAVTDEKGHFKFEWVPHKAPPPGWHDVTVRLVEHLGRDVDVVGRARVFSPHSHQFAIISDIDDTFLISHSSKTLRRLRVLLTRSAQGRKPFKDVVRHYQALAKGTGTHEQPTPFFYVSSSEWNLYDYLRSFLSTHGLPDGILLLSPLKRLANFWRSGQNKHSLKFIRIARIINSYPQHRYILLGDDTQQDPYIYQQIAQHHPERVHAIYIRKVNRANFPKVQAVIQELKAKGIHCCYFKHSSEALEHSRSIGLVT
jgi:phosphatidate phosphatase APP1